MLLIAAESIAHSTHLFIAIKWCLSSHSGVSAMLALVGVVVQPTQYVLQLVAPRALQYRSTRRRRRQYWKLDRRASRDLGWVADPCRIRKYGVLQRRANDSHKVVL